MTTGATGQLGLALPVQGELSGTWGDTVNNGITQYTNIAIAATLTLTNDGAVTLANTTGDASATNITSSLTGAGTVTAQFAIVKVTGTLTTTKVITAPSYSKTYVVVNAATGGTVTFKASGQTGVSIAVGESAWVYYNGTDYVKIVGTATAGAAGGSNTQVQYNSSGSLAGSANMTFDGTSLTLGGNPTLSAGTANGVTYLNGSKVLTSGSALTFDGTTLTTSGLLTTADASALSTFGRFSSGYTWSLIRPSTTSTGIEFRTFAGDALYQLDQSSGANKHIWYTGASEQMRLTSTGLGIGTSSPVSKLDVKKTSNDTVSRTNSVGAFGDWDSLGAGLLLQQTLSSPYGFALQASNAANSVQFPLLLNPSGGNVGIGTSSPAYKLDIANATYARLLTTTYSNGGIINARTSASNGTYNTFDFVEGSTTTAFLRNYGSAYGSSLDNFLILQNNQNAPITFATNATERMRLDSSGNLTIGSTTAIGKLGVWSAANGDTLAAFRCAGTGTQRALYISGDNSTGIISLDVTGSAGGSLAIKSGGAQTALFDTSGNLGLGVTPSASSSKTFEIGSVGNTITTTGANEIQSTAGAYYNAGWKYAVSSAAITNYIQSGGVHTWRIAGSGTAGNAVSWTSAMTLDASGNLGIGTTTPNTVGYGGAVLGLYAGSNAGGNVWLTSDATAAGNRTGRIGFGTEGNSTNKETARVWSVTAGSTAGNVGGDLLFSTKSDGGALAERARISSTGGLSVGTTADPGAGAIYATGNITAYYSSDIKFKENVREIPDALAKVNAIGGKLFDWTDKYIADHGGADGYFVQKSDFGVIAQDVQKVFPVAVRTRDDGSLAVDYEKLGALAFAALVELTKRVEALEAK